MTAVVDDPEPAKPAGMRPVERATPRGGSPVEPAPEPGAPSGPRDWSSRRKPFYSLGAILGAVIVLASIAGIVLNFTLPWAEVRGDFGQFGSTPSQTFDRADLKDQSGSVPYDDRLVDWPLIGFIVAIAAGVALVGLDLLPFLSHTSHRYLRMAALLAAGYGAFLPAITGVRWIGNWIESKSQPLGLELTPLAAPWVNLALGLAMVAGVAWLVQRDASAYTKNVAKGRLGPRAVRLPLLALAVAAGALLVAPLVPYTVTETSVGDFHFYEHTYAHLGEESESGESSDDVGRDLGWVRLMLWIAMYASIISAFAAMVERSGKDFLTWGTLAQAQVVHLVTFVVGLIFIILSYVHMADIEQTTITFNHVLPVAYVALAVVFLLWVRDVLVPYATHAKELAPAETEAAPPSQ